MLGRSARQEWPAAAPAQRADSKEKAAQAAAAGSSGFGPSVGQQQAAAAAPPLARSPSLRLKAGSAGGCVHALHGLPLVAWMRSLQAGKRPMRGRPHMRGKWRRCSQAAALPRPATCSAARHACMCAARRAAALTLPHNLGARRASGPCRSVAAPGLIQRRTGGQLSMPQCPLAPACMFLGAGGGGSAVGMLRPFVSLLSTGPV